MLVNPITYALFVGALTHDGPEDQPRIARDTVCNESVPLGLDLDDLLGTEAVALDLAALEISRFEYDGNDIEPVQKLCSSMSRSSGSALCCRYYAVNTLYTMYLTTLLLTDLTGSNTS
jgi:hypothetical protein